jgi:hypothetical protein
MTSRALTSAEVALSRSVFGDAIAYDRVQVFARKWWPFQHRQMAMAPDGNLWLPPKGSLYCDDFCEHSIDRQGLFIHEMTHVWQHQQGVNLILKRHPFCRYDYALKPGWPLERYGLEQQAEIVRHYFMLREGLPIGGATALESYRAILPFGPLE